MVKEYKISKHNSTVCGYPGRGFVWSKFCWDGSAIGKCKPMKAPLPWVDNGLIADGCEYLHVPYDWTERGTIYRVRPNPTMYAGEKYRGHLVESVKAIKKDDGWYWVITFKMSQEMVDYLFHCNECSWKDTRYGNLRVCPQCGAPVSRVNDDIVCFHGTTRERAQQILTQGFKPDSWFALHMEDALRMGGDAVLGVKFQCKLIPKGWQFHVLKAVPVEQIVSRYLVQRVFNY